MVSHDAMMFNTLQLLKKILLVLFRPMAWGYQKMSLIGRVWAHARLSSQVNSKVDSTLVIYSSPEVIGTGNINLGKHLLLYRDLYFETQGSGRIEISDHVVISRGVHIVSFSRISIGKYAMIGEYTSIRDANHIVHQNISVRESGHASSPIIIGDNVWIGRGVTILKGTTIGDNAIIGANAVVTHDVQSNTVVAGVPARPIENYSMHR